MQSPAASLQPVAAVARRLRIWRDARLSEGRHSDRAAAILGIALGVSFVVCFATGMLSHLIQHPPSWFSWTTRPAGLYRVTQGVHVATGIATIPLLFAKLWSVFPRLFQWPIATGALNAIERLSLLPLVGGSLFMLVTGLANIELWYPWVFFFPAGHYAVSFVVMGALLIHLVAKMATTRRALSRADGSVPEPAVVAASRRRFLGAVAAVSAGAVVVTVGQTVSPLRRLALLAPRHPDIGTQGFPVNKTAREAGITQAAATEIALTVEAQGGVLRSFTVDELRAMPARVATLPIACVEGWSANRTWRGISVRDVLEQAQASFGTIGLGRIVAARWQISPLDTDDWADRRRRHPAGVRGRRRAAPPRPRIPIALDRTEPAGGPADEVGEQAGGPMSTEPHADRPSARVFVPTLLIGWAIISFGAHSALGDARDAHPFALAVHIVTFDLVHDLVIAPALFLGAWALGKVTPAVARGPVRAAAAATVLYIAIAYPLIRRWGRRPTNSSTLPLNYGRNLTIVIVAVWLIAATVIGRRVRSARRLGAAAEHGRGDVVPHP